MPKHASPVRSDGESVRLVLWLHNLDTTMPEEHVPIEASVLSHSTRKGKIKRYLSLQPSCRGYTSTCRALGLTEAQHCLLQLVLNAVHMQNTLTDTLLKAEVIAAL